MCLVSVVISTDTSLCHYCCSLPRCTAATAAADHREYCMPALPYDDLHGCNSTSLDLGTINRCSSASIELNDCSARQSSTAVPEDHVPLVQQLNYRFSTSATTQAEQEQLAAHMADLTATKCGHRLGLIVAGKPLLVPAPCCSCGGRVAGAAAAVATAVAAGSWSCTRRRRSERHGSRRWQC